MGVLSRAQKGVSPKLCSPWQGPAEIVVRLSQVVYQVKLPNRGRLVVLHQDRLAPYRPHAPVTAGSGDDTSPTDSSVEATPQRSQRPVRQRRRPE